MSPPLALLARLGFAVLVLVAGSLGPDSWLAGRDCPPEGCP